MPLNTFVDRIFVLNLARSADRRQHIVQSFARLGISNYEFIEAVDGRDLDIESLRRGGHVLRDAHQKRELTPGEIGCHFSHQKAWATGLSRGFERFLVCEDDVEFSDACHDIAQRFMSEVPPDWDILHFHSTSDVGSGVGRDARRQRITDTVYRGWNEGGGCLCYALTSRGASRLLALASPIRYAVDGVTNWLTGDWKECAGYRGYVCSPFIVRESGHRSTIGRRPPGVTAAMLEAVRQRDSSRSTGARPESNGEATASRNG